MKFDFPGSKEINSLFSDISDSELLQSQQYKMIEPYISSMLMIFLTVYGGHAVPNLRENKAIVNFMKNPLVRIIGVAVIAITLKLSKTNGLLIAISFMLSLQLIDRVEDNFIDFVEDTMEEVTDVVSDVSQVVLPPPPPAPVPVKPEPPPEPVFNVEGVSSGSEGAPL